ncbi:Crp/Fnr family transcriptional regulator [Xenorhabdus sp. Flor]|uniref:Crp/Fnr family transcriptional regulator n=1 Tax=Xenorhabdus cabanillasii TaxID=351673 RepID=UPI0019923B73|nr:Crp/Fnr family transcriptional regulator [Xenorhabdus sp. Flor]MBD2814308.1 Crp/Fnr family transcriptional regulator [Xenorhabdus sp. Flor]
MTISSSPGSFFPEALLSTARLIGMDKNKSIVTQNHRLSFLYCLVEGRLQVEYYDLDGRTVVFSIQEPLSLTGDLELFYGKEKRTVSTVKALCASQLLSFPATAVREYGYNNPVFLRFICSNLSRKLFDASQSKTTVTITSENKLRRYLATQFQLCGKSFTLEKRETLASMLGISVRQLNRSLSELVRVEVISLKNRTLHIINHDLL